jgi:hypothetical protein
VRSPPSTSLNFNCKYDWILAVQFGHARSINTQPRVNSRREEEKKKINIYNRIFTVCFPLRKNSGHHVHHSLPKWLMTKSRCYFFLVKNKNCAHFFLIFCIVSVRKFVDCFGHIDHNKLLF